MIVGDFEHRQLPFRQRFRSIIGDDIIRVHQAQLRRDLLVRAKEVEQPDKHELIVGLRIDPQFNRIEFCAELEKATIPGTEIFQPAQPSVVEPGIADIAMLCRTLLQPQRKLLLRRQPVHDEANRESKGNVRQMRRLQLKWRKVICRQDQTGHAPLPDSVLLSSREGIPAQREKYADPGHRTDSQENDRHQDRIFTRALGVARLNNKHRLFP